MGKILEFIGGNGACGARWTLGTLLLAPLSAANSSYCAVPAILTLSAWIAFATLTIKDLKKLSTILPPLKTSRGRRDRNFRSFGDFMSMWMTFLSHLVAVAICARILSATADHVTEGKTRRWLFGFETRALGEPWPDVLGVTVVLVVCTMFMCGLEESIMFTIILMFILFVFSQIFAVFGLVYMDLTSVNLAIPLTPFELIVAGAPLSYIFSVELPEKDGTKLRKNMMIMIGIPTAAFTGLCFLYANLLKGNTIDAALPVATLIESRAGNWVSPIMTLITVIGVSLALTQLCPLLFNILVVLASPEWKVLTRSMTYESASTGSPVLAVFTAGSLAAILAFACPLAHMITLMNASHLIGVAIQAFHFSILRCVPTAEQKEAGDVEYKRLGVPSTSNVKIEGVKKSKIWSIPCIRQTKTLESLKSKIIKGAEKEDQECLLLNEYSSPSHQIDVNETTYSDKQELDAESNCIDDTISDVDVSDNDISSGDDSTDIDAVVKEYKDTVQVVMSSPESSAPIPPCVRGAKFSAFGCSIQVIADILIAVGVCSDRVQTSFFACGFTLWIIGIVICMMQPSHKLNSRKGQSLEGPIAMLGASLFLTPLLIDSWPAILLFAGAGIVIYARCERWCGDLALKQARNVIERRKLATVAVPMANAQIAQLEAVYITR